MHESEAIKKLSFKFTIFQNFLHTPRLILKKHCFSVKYKKYYPPFGLKVNRTKIVFCLLLSSATKHNRKKSSEDVKKMNQKKRFRSGSNISKFEAIQNKKKSEKSHSFFCLRPSLATRYASAFL